MVATIGKELWLLSAAIRHMNAAYDWNLPNPVPGRVPQPRKKEMRWFTCEEATTLMRASSEGRAGDHMGDFVRLAACRTFPSRIPLKSCSDVTRGTGGTV